MKIQNMELFKVPPRWLFLKITTDDGLVGWGEPILEGRADTVRTAVEEMSGYLIGKDPSPIEDIWQVLYRGGFYRGGPILTSALSGIEQALWDIKGKRFGVPIYELLGGPVREKVRVRGERGHRIWSGYRDRLSWASSQGHGEGAGEGVSVVQALVH
jgi:galactonate dehydratase